MYVQVNKIIPSDGRKVKKIREKNHIIKYNLTS